MSAVTVSVPLLCFLTSATLGLAVSASPPTQPPPAQDLGADGVGGLSAAFWLVLEDCFGGGGGGKDAVRPAAAVCLKYKVLTALDRALGKSVLTVADGVSLAALADKPPGRDEPLRADLDALDAVRDVADKDALLDDMLADRLDEFVATRTLVIDDGPAGDEGRGKKKNKAMKQAIMMTSMIAAAVMGPMAISAISFIAVKALLVSKIALVLSSIMAIKKFLSQKQKNSHQTEPVVHHIGRNMKSNAHDIAYLEQKQ